MLTLTASKLTTTQSAASVTADREEAAMAEPDPEVIPQAVLSPLTRAAIFLGGHDRSGR